MAATITARQALDQLVTLRARRIRLREEYDGDGLREIAAKLDQAWKDAAAALQRQTFEVPDGWQLVPIEAPPKIIEAICRAHAAPCVWPGDYGATAQRLRREHAADGWDDALRAAPEPPGGV